MASVPPQFPPRYVGRTSFPSRAWLYAQENLNFYRIHLLVFTITPLFFSGIMYGSNGKYPISYIDCLFNCVSAMTVTGLATVNLSQLTGWQQCILFLLMSVGNIVAVSWIMVLVRKQFFRSKFEYIVNSRMARDDPEGALRRRNNAHYRGGRFRDWLRRRNHTESKSSSSNGVGSAQKKEVHDKLRPDMIRRVHGAPRLVNPMGWISEQEPREIEKTANGVGAVSAPKDNEDTMPGAANLIPSNSEISTPQSATTSHPSSWRLPRRFSDPGGSTSTPKLKSSDQKFSRCLTSEPDSRPGELSEIHTASPVDIPNWRPNRASDTPSAPGFPRTQTIEFAPTQEISPRRRRNIASAHAGRALDSYPDVHDDESSQERHARTVRVSSGSRGAPRTSTLHTVRSSLAATHTTGGQGVALSRPSAGGDVGFGGFPMPHQILGRLISAILPSLSRRVQRTISVPARTITVGSQGATGTGTVRTGLGIDAHTESVPYISFDAVVGRNSYFHDLTKEEVEELGGVEYRALQMLLWLVPAYHFSVQLISLCVIAPVIATKWQAVLRAQIRYITPGWYSAFVVVSAYTNSGMSLVDQSLIPFQTAIPQLLFLVWVIFAGNTAYPAFLRFTIWTITKIIPKKSRAQETLHFLLDHPRRCFVYLFPSHQTWFLLTFIILLTVTDWVSFLLLDIGNPEIDSIPVGHRILDGLVQSAAVRSAGFSVVNLSNLAPAVKVLYVIMMYVSIYPIALSVRSSNVYEERSLGIMEDKDSANAGDEPDHDAPRAKVWGAYLAWHARKQLAFDMWWLSFALVLLCIIERGPINDEAKDSIDIFPIMFELVSAYGTVGLSLGITGLNVSLSAAFSPLSKLVVCAVMLRGRHRGLPVAIDRAVLLPRELKDEMTSHDRPTSQHQSRGSLATRDIAQISQVALPEELELASEKI